MNKNDLLDKLKSLLLDTHVCRLDSYKVRCNVESMLHLIRDYESKEDKLARLDPNDYRE